VFWLGHPCIPLHALECTCSYAMHVICMTSQDVWEIPYLRSAIHFHASFCKQELSRLTMCLLLSSFCDLIPRSDRECNNSSAIVLICNKFILSITHQLNHQTYTCTLGGISAICNMQNGCLWWEQQCSTNTVTYVYCTRLKKCLL